MKLCAEIFRFQWQMENSLEELGSYPGLISTSPFILIIIE